MGSILGLIAAIAVGASTLFVGYIPTEEIEEMYESAQYTSIIFEAVCEEGETITDEDMAAAESIVRARLDSMGLVEAVIIMKEDNKIEVRFPYEELAETVTETVEKEGKLEFLSADGEVLMNADETMIKSVNAKFGVTSSYNNSEHYVQIDFTEEGQKAFYEATKASVGSYIAIALDGQVLSAPNVTEPIDAEQCIITGDFDKESAAEMANVINSGVLPFKLKAIID